VPQPSFFFVCQLYALILLCVAGYWRTLRTRSLCAPPAAAVQLKMTLKEQKERAALAFEKVDEEACTAVSKMQVSASNPSKSTEKKKSQIHTSVIVCAQSSHPVDDILDLQTNSRSSLVFAALFVCHPHFGFSEKPPAAEYLIILNIFLSPDRRMRNPGRYLHKSGVENIRKAK
jgi:hypothetical protein